MLPWIFVAGLAAASLLPARNWDSWFRIPPKSAEELQRDRDSELVWQRAGNPSVRHPVDVIRTVDGDTFEARVQLWPGLELATRVRLRGIDAPEFKAACEFESQKAEASAKALRLLLNEGDVAIYNIGPDKYSGRVVADVASRRTPNLSTALIAAGHARSYRGGRRESWCNGAAR